MDHDRQLIGLDLEFSMAMGTDIGSGHEYIVTAYSDQGDGNGNIVPRHVSGLAKPVDRTGGQREEHDGQDEQQDGFFCVFHRVTAFLEPV